MVATESQHTKHLLFDAKIRIGKWGVVTGEVRGLMAEGERLAVSG